MPFEFQSSPELVGRRRRGLAVSVAIHLLLALFVVINPDFFNTTPTRVIRIAGEEFDPDRFEIQELFLPPELVPVPESPSVVAPPPVPEIELPPPVAEAAPPPPLPSPPEPPPEEPPPVITPDDVIAEGARPDAPPSPLTDEGVEALEAVEPPPAGDGGPESGEGGEEGEAEFDVPQSTSEEAPSEQLPVEVTRESNPDVPALPNLRRRAEDIIEQALAQERRQGAPGRPGVADGLSEPFNVDTEQPRILSDTRGYDFGPYMNQVINRVRFNWYSFIPEAARLGRQGRAVIIFTIQADGGVTGLRIASSSGAESLDRAASAAIQASNPFPRIPADFDGDNLVLQFAFLYNLRR